MIQSGDKVLVKLYGESRLYDTRAARYVTRDEVAAIARAGQPVEVRDAKSGEDITLSFVKRMGS